MAIDLSTESITGVGTSEFSDIDQFTHTFLPSVKSGYNKKMKFIHRLVPIAFYLLLWSLVVYFIEPPRSWPEATSGQILVFFIPLTLALTFIIELFFNYFPHSFIAALGLLMLLVMFAINQLTVVSGGITLLITTLLIKIFPRVRLLPRIRLTPLLKKLKILPPEGKNN